MGNETFGQADAKPDVIRMLRTMAAGGATAPELVREIQTRLGYSDQAVIPVLWYLVQAFGLSLKDVLPLREWIGTSDTKEMNAILMPLIEAARDQWEEKPEGFVSPLP